MNSTESAIYEYDSADDIIDNEHIISYPEPFYFELDKDFDYLRKELPQTLWYILIRTVVHVILNVYNRIAFGLKIKGIENLNKTLCTGGVVICNHVHTLDCTFIDCTFPFKRMYYTTLESNFKIPIARHLIRFLGGVPIPTKIHNMPSFKNNMQYALQKGNLVCMYPEGILHPYYKNLRDFKDGAFKLATISKCPIIPIVITFRKPKGLFRLYKKKPCVTLNILSPIDSQVEKNNHKNIKALKKRCYNQMNRVIENSKVS